MSKEDYLDIDDPINGQNWVCLSFVSPENVLKDKDAFTVAKFLQSHASARAPLRLRQGPREPPQPLQRA